MARSRFLPESVLSRLLVVTLFAIAMAYVEAAVVVYLRALFHIAGDLVSAKPPKSSVWFSVPYFTLLKPGALASVLPAARVARTEVAREVATVVMLASVAWLAGRNATSRFAYFIHAFAVWDIGYYAFLYLLIGWPASIKALDVLFLIPGPWVAPVFLPVLISVLMIATALLLLRREGR